MFRRKSSKKAADDEADLSNNLVRTDILEVDEEAASLRQRQSAESGFELVLEDPQQSQQLAATPIRRNHNLLADQAASYEASESSSPPRRPFNPHHYHRPPPYHRNLMDSSYDDDESYDDSSYDDSYDDGSSAGSHSSSDDEDDDEASTLEQLHVHQTTTLDRLRCRKPQLHDDNHIVAIQKFPTDRPKKTAPVVVSGSTQPQSSSTSSSPALLSKLICRRFKPDQEQQSHHRPSRSAYTNKDAKKPLIIKTNNNGNSSSSSHPYHGTPTKYRAQDYYDSNSNNNNNNRSFASMSTPLRKKSPSQLVNRSSSSSSSGPLLKSKKKKRFFPRPTSPCRKRTEDDYDDGRDDRTDDSHSTENSDTPRIVKRLNQSGNSSNMLLNDTTYDGDDTYDEEDTTAFDEYDDDDYDEESIANLQRALSKVQKELQNSGGKNNRKEITQKLMRVAQSLQKQEGRRKLRRRGRRSPGKSNNRKNVDRSVETSFDSSALSGRKNNSSAYQRRLERANNVNNGGGVGAFLPGAGFLFGAGGDEVSLDESSFTAWVGQLEEEGSVDESDLSGVKGGETTDIMGFLLSPFRTPMETSFDTSTYFTAPNSRLGAGMDRIDEDEEEDETADLATRETDSRTMSLEDDEEEDEDDDESQSNILNPWSSKRVPPPSSSHRPSPQRRVAAAPKAKQQPTRVPAIPARVPPPKITPLPQRLQQGSPRDTLPRRDRMMSGGNNNNNNNSQNNASPAAASTPVRNEEPRRGLFLPTEPFVSTPRPTLMGGPPSSPLFHHPNNRTLPTPNSAPIVGIVSKNNNHHSNVPTPTSVSSSPSSVLPKNSVHSHNSNSRLPHGASTPKNRVAAHIAKHSNNNAAVAPSRLEERFGQYQHAAPPQQRPRPQTPSSVVTPFSSEQSLDMSLGSIESSQFRHTATTSNRNNNHSSSSSPMRVIRTNDMDFVRRKGQIMAEGDDNSSVWGSTGLLSVGDDEFDRARGRVQLT